LQIHQLEAHPNFAAGKVKAVSVRWSPLPDGRLMLRYQVKGCGALIVPPFHGKGRADDLWRMTCFELFLYDGAGRYREFNFSPCQQWAAYRFNGYRGQREDFEPLRMPEIHSERGSSIFMLTAFIALGELDGASMAGLSAVIEEEDRRQSYWALAHSPLRPDFHDPACFRLPLGPAERQ
jgi:hypothetical protein